MKVFVPYRPNIKAVTLIFGLFLSLFSSDQSIQNLVNNYSGERYSYCPNLVGEIFDPIDWFRLPINGTPDYLNSCATSTTVHLVNNYRNNSLHFGFALVLQTKKNQNVKYCYHVENFRF